MFNAANDTASSNIPSRELAKRRYPNVSLSRDIGEFEGLLSNRKIREVLGFKEVHDLRLYVD